jgi:hypothetical protein
MKSATAVGESSEIEMREFIDALPTASRFRSLIQISSFSNTTQYPPLSAPTRLIKLSSFNPARFDSIVFEVALLL